MHASGLYGLAGSDCAVLTSAFMAAPNLVCAICKSLFSTFADKYIGNPDREKPYFYKGKIRLAKPLPPNHAATDFLSYAAHSARAAAGTVPPKSVASEGVTVPVRARLVIAREACGVLI
jgi:hypothetical protein